MTRLADSLTNGGAIFSPDGARIAFLSDRDRTGRAEVYVMVTDGSGQTRLTPDLHDDRNVAWLPSGLAIASTSSRGG